MVEAGTSPAVIGDESSLFDVSTELGRDYSAIDWAATPLGPTDSWPTSLNNTVRLVIASRFAMWLCWGDELTFFCDDEYRRDILGAKYPWALGRAVATLPSVLADQLLPRGADDDVAVLICRVTDRPSGDRVAVHEVEAGAGSVASARQFVSATMQAWGGSDEVSGRGLLLVASVAARWGTRSSPSGKAVWCLFRTPSGDGRQRAAG